jgi:hypothetical protein
MKTDVYERDATRMGTGGQRAGNKTGSSRPGFDQAEMMKKMEAAGTPGPAHKALDALVGEWKAEVKCWEEPGGSPEVTRATSTNRWKFNGRFLEEEFHGEMMGKPFTGCMLLGYDNTKQLFNSVWVTDTQTSMFTSEGKSDSGFKVITLEGKTDCPATGQKNVPMKMVLRLISPDQHVFEMYDGSRGNAKTMEITYTRS